MGPLRLPTGSELEGNREIAAAAESAAAKKVRQELTTLVSRGMNPLRAADEWMRKFETVIRASMDPSPGLDAVLASQRKFVTGIAQSL